MSKQIITDAGDLRKYRTEIPNMADDDLDPFQFRLYGHYKRVCGANSGTCTESVRTTVAKCRMSAEKVISVRQWLHDNGWIEQEQQESGSYHITILDRWEENFIRFARRPLEIPNTTVRNSEQLPLEIPNTTVRNSEHKKELYKKEHMLASQDVPPPVVSGGNQPTEQQAMFGKVCEIVGWDSTTLDEKAKGAVAQALGVLKKGGYTLEDLNQFGARVWVKDWRWTEKRQHPTLTQLRQEIGKLRTKGFTAASGGIDWNNAFSGSEQPEYLRQMLGGGK